MLKKYLQKNYFSRNTHDNSLSLVNNNITKNTFNSPFNLSKENIPFNNNSININDNVNIKLKRQSSYSKLDDQYKEFFSKVSKQKIKLLSINYIKRKKERNSKQKNNSSVKINNNYDTPKSIINTLNLDESTTASLPKKKILIKPYKSCKKFIPVENKKNINIKKKLTQNTSFEYLIHQAYKNKALSKSFNKFYKSSRSKEKDNKDSNKEKIPNKIMKIKYIKKTNKLINNSNLNKNNNNIKTISLGNTRNKKYFNTSFNNDNNNNNNINNNISCFKTNEYEQSPQYYNNINNNNDSSMLINRKEIFYNILKKIKKIINKIDAYEQIHEECNDFIQYYFSNKIYNKILYFFSNENIINYCISCIKKEIIFFYLCYDISIKNIYYNKTAILLKVIFNIIYSNYILIINFDKEIDFLKKIQNNFYNFNNYYKIIIDNFYKKNFVGLNTDMRFPNCVKNETLKNKNHKLISYIVSSFFCESYKTSSVYNHYSISDLEKFFNFFLNCGGGGVCENFYEKKKKMIESDIKNVSINIKFLLPKKIKNCGFSLVLDLDQTLINYNKITNKIIFRPGLLSFLHSMKKIYELILFSYGTETYVNSIINHIEKNEKFFDFILYRQHVSFDENGEFFKNLNLLNRNLKNIIIIDNNVKNFRYHKNNGICIKPFFGNFDEDKNFLNILTLILGKIEFDAEKTGDIRISIKNIKNENNNIFQQILNYNN